MEQGINISNGSGDFTVLSNGSVYGITNSSPKISTIDYLKNSWDRADSIIKSKLEENGYMYETLYEVIVVNQTREILVEKKVVAASEESAKFQVSYEVLKEKNLTPDDVTTIVKNLGSVKVKKDN
jgi:hypothetical protein